MELLLTPVVSRLLRRFIKSADGQASSNLRVSLSRGSVVLQNLELDFDELLHKLPVRVERAFARQLRIVIPWTSLATQPIQVALALARVKLPLAIEFQACQGPPWLAPDDCIHGRQYSDLPWTQELTQDSMAGLKFLAALFDVKGWQAHFCA